MSVASNLTYTLDELPFFWRAMIVAGGVLVSLSAYRLLHLDFLPLPLFLSLFPVLPLVGLSVCRRSWQSPMLPFLSVFLVFVTMFIDSFSSRSFGISPKSNQLVFLFSLLFAGFYFLRDFQFYWRHWQVRIAFAFFIVTLIYFFFHASDFDISRVKYGYVLLITAGLEINSPPVRNIILISSLSLLVANVLAISPFSKHALSDQKASATFLKISFSVLAYSLIVVTGCFLSKGAKWNYGMHYYLPLVMLVGCVGYYLVKKHHAMETAWLLPIPLSRFLGGALLFSGLFLPLFLNKTSLFGTLLCFAMFFALTQGAGYGDFLKVIWRFASHNFSSKLFLAFVLMGLLLLAGVFGVFELFASKIDYVVSGLSKNSSMKVREGNWQYFLQDWQQTLDFWRVLFGYGIGASRKTIFYISAMRDGPHESNLVQTLHNGYMEYLYDYGCMSLLYFGLYAHFLRQAWLSLKNRCNMESRVLGAAQFGIILYAAFYSLTDGLRVQMLIQIFVLLGFMQGLKGSYARNT